MGARWPVERVLAAKLVLGAVGVLLGLFQIASGFSGNNVFVALVVVALGYFGPDLVLWGRAQERQKKIQKGLADTLDQLTISVEAGLGFEAALAQAARSGRGPLAEEFAHTLQDIQIGMARGQAFAGLVERTDCADLRHFVVALKQAEEYGVPIAQVLRVQAKEMRQKRSQSAEERAMKIPVKIIFPVIFCILPALFVVIIGPAALRIADNLLGK